MGALGTWASSQAERCTNTIVHRLIALHRLKDGIGIRRSGESNEEVVASYRAGKREKVAPRDRRGHSGKQEGVRGCSPEDRSSVESSPAFTHMQSFCKALRRGQYALC